MLDLTSLQKAVASLGRAVERSQKDLKDEELRDAVIQRFEYTFELCWKMLKRQIESESANPAEVDSLSYRNLLRDAAERGIVAEVTEWFHFRDQRNLTSHIYDEKKAASVYLTACQFLKSAQLLLAILQNRP